METSTEDWGQNSTEQSVQVCVSVQWNCPGPGQTWAVSGCSMTKPLEMMLLWEKANIILFIIQLPPLAPIKS
jgi:hypothetical protein